MSTESERLRQTVNDHLRPTPRTGDTDWFDETQRSLYEAYERACRRQRRSFRLHMWAFALACGALSAGVMAVMQYWVLP